MRIIHFSDTHLGFAAYRKISAHGYNVREEDICQAFKQCIDKILELRPDLVLHSGDLFDCVRPTNRILTFALEQILRILAQNIPLIIISGNHETPKQRYLGSVFSIFEKIQSQNKLLYVVYQNEYVPITVNQVSVHAIPQCSSDEIFKGELKKVKENPATKNILMLHAGVTGMREFSRGDFNELLVDYSYFDKHNFDYVALGHYHNYTQIRKNVYFSGSTERLSFNESNLQKGFIEIDLGNQRPKFHELEIRSMLEMPPIDGQGKDTPKLMEEIESVIKNAQVKDKIVRLKVSRVPGHILSTLDIKKIRELAQEAVHFEPIFEKLEEGKKVLQIKTTFSNLKEEYISFINQYPELKPEDRETYKKLGLNALDEVLKK